MYQFLLGFAVGVYVGTVYDCKPFVDRAHEFVKEHAPKEQEPKEK